MAKQTQEPKNKSLVKIYLILLFVFGIILGFSFLSANKNKILLVDQKLDNDIVTVLTSSDVEQINVITQFAKETKRKGLVYNEYYKKIKIPKNKNFKKIEQSFKKLAVEFKLNLSKTRYKDVSCKYVFYDDNRTYSTIVLTK